MNTIYAFIAVILFSFSAQAKSFSSPFLNFDLAPGWTCQNFSGTWNCKNSSASKHKAFIAVTAKKARLGTTLTTYKNKLLKPFSRTWNGKVVNSKPQSAEEVSIRGQKWIQSTHIDGEIPNSMTKYLITVKNGLSILVTFSAHNDDYPILSNDFMRSIESLKLNPKLSPKMAAPNNQTNIANNNLDTGNELDDIFDTDPTQTKGSGKLTIGSLKKLGAIALLIIAALLFLISRRKKKV